MPRYDRIWALLAERATAQGVLDVEAFMALLNEAGISEARMIEMLEEDLANDGPVFGKFMRGITGAATSTVGTAVRQGELIGAIDGDAELRRLTRLAGMEGSGADALERADPEAAEAVAVALSDDIRMTWIAELINTCHRCLPLHGSTLTMGQWRELLLLPETIHQGWDSSCHCRLVPAGIAEGQAQL